jgi:hypothetical protein
MPEGCTQILPSYKTITVVHIFGKQRIRQDIGFINAQAIPYLIFGLHMRLFNMPADFNTPLRRARVYFAARYALCHLAISVVVALLFAALVFGLLYPAPYRNLLGVGAIFLLVLAVDIVCGPLLTLILASPTKSRRERWVDFSLIGLIQIAALAYGLHSVWLVRPVALVFEVDRLVVVTANELAVTQAAAPPGLRQLPVWGQIKASTRKPASSDDMLQSIDTNLAGISLAVQPDWWAPWEQALPAMATRAKPIADLLARRPRKATILQDAIHATGLPATELRYLPLVTSKTLDWVALLDARLNMVGWARVDGFE